MASPETRYAKSGDFHIAYQTLGEGPLDLLMVPGWVSHVEYAWEVPSYAAFLRRLASFSRLIFLDRRGTGLSDPVGRLPTLEERMEDVRAVLDATGSERSALLGISEGGPMCMLFAASYPERTAGLALYGTFACGKKEPDYPWRMPLEARGQVLDAVIDRWGQGVFARFFAPSRADDEEFVRQWSKFERMAASPGAMRAIFEMIGNSDVREILPTIRVPTLVVNRAGDEITPAGGARYIAERIPGARYLELEGADHFPWTGDVESIVGPIEEFLTGVRRAPESDRVLATVLFADIVGSTERIAELGDRGWRDVLGRFQELLAERVVRHAGRVVDTAGDGLLAAFDGPARAVRCASEIRDSVRTLGLPLRIGLHTGECERLGEKYAGIAVHIGARVAECAEPGEILVTGTVRDLVVGSELRFDERGCRELRGVPGEWRLLAVAA